MADGHGADVLDHTCDDHIQRHQRGRQGTALGSCCDKLQEAVREVPAGSFQEVLLTRDFTPLHPEILEYKMYAKGVGPVLVLGISGGSGHEDLVEYVLGT
ncbi:MAG: hypothetical protein LH650_14340 [Chloroflexi bacterium]|nr:hypothetical protein [Chloroflexota bacterium]